MTKHQKTKRRVLSARENRMRERYTRTAKYYPKCYGVFLVVGVQSFKIGGEVGLVRQADWMRDMLAIALAGIES